MKNIYSSILFALILMGYPIAAGITGYFSIEINLLSIIYRIIVLMGAVILTFSSYFIERPKFGYGILIGILFVLYYSIRMYLEWMLNPLGSKIPWDDFWIFLLLVCLIPAIPFIWRRNLPEENFTINTIMVLGVIGLTLNFYSVLQVKMIAVDDLLFGGRLESDRLNPISYGHLAVTTTLIGLWSIISKRKLSILATLATILGVLGIASSGSRGPVLSFVFCLALLLIYLKIEINYWKILFATIALVALNEIFFAGYIDEIYLSSRVAESMFEDQARYEIYIEAYRTFLDNILTGAGYPLDTYPHNIILEAFMSSGVVGGILITATLLVGLVAAMRNLSENIYSWVSLIFIQYLIFSMVSSSIYYSNILWMLWVCVVVVRNIKKYSKSAGIPSVYIK